MSRAAVDLVLPAPLLDRPSPRAVRASPNLARLAQKQVTPRQPEAKQPVPA
jgi:hypothetical protein